MKISIINFVRTGQDKKTGSEALMVIDLNVVPG